MSEYKWEDLGGNGITFILNGEHKGKRIQSVIHFMKNFVRVDDPNDTLVDVWNIEVSRIFNEDKRLTLHLRLDNNFTAEQVKEKAEKLFVGMIHDADIFNLGETK